jgi:hypothetical protein
VQSPAKNKTEPLKDSSVSKSPEKQQMKESNLLNKSTAAKNIPVVQKPVTDSPQLSQPRTPPNRPLKPVTKPADPKSLSESMSMSHLENKATTAIPQKRTQSINPPEHQRPATKGTYATKLQPLEEPQSPSRMTNGVEPAKNEQVDSHGGNAN